MKKRILALVIILMIFWGTVIVLLDNRNTESNCDKTELEIESEEESSDLEIDVGTNSSEDRCMESEEFESAEKECAKEVEGIPSSGENSVDISLPDEGITLPSDLWD